MKKLAPLPHHVHATPAAPSLDLQHWFGRRYGLSVSRSGSLQVWVRVWVGLGWVWLWFWLSLTVDCVWLCVCLDLCLSARRWAQCAYLCARKQPEARNVHGNKQFSLFKGAWKVCYETFRTWSIQNLSTNISNIKALTLILSWLHTKWSWVHGTIVRQRVTCHAASSKLTWGISMQCLDTSRESDASHVWVETSQAEGTSGCAFFLPTLLAAHVQNHLPLGQWATHTHTHSHGICKYATNIEQLQMLQRGWTTESSVARNLSRNCNFHYAKWKIVGNSWDFPILSQCVSHNNNNNEILLPNDDYQICTKCY